MLESRYCLKDFPISTYIFKRQKEWKKAKKTKLGKNSGVEGKGQTRILTFFFFLKIIVCLYPEIPNISFKDS